MLLVTPITNRVVSRLLNITILFFFLQITKNEMVTLRVPVASFFFLSFVLPQAWPFEPRQTAGGFERIFS